MILGTPWFYKERDRQLWWLRVSEEARKEDIIMLIIELLFLSGFPMFFVYLFLCLPGIIKIFMSVCIVLSLFAVVLLIRSISDAIKDLINIKNKITYLSTHRDIQTKRVPKM